MITKKMRKQLHNRKKLTILVILVGSIILLLLLGYMQFFYHITSAKTPPIESMAEKVLKICTSRGKKKISCYDEQIAQMTKQVSMDQAFQITHLVQKQDADYSYCHVVGHKIAGEEVKKDPSKWQEVVRKCPTDQCANGCIHGAFEERFKAENLPDSQIELIKPQLLSVCLPGSQDHGFVTTQACFHAMGHMFMYISKANFIKSIDLCNQMITHDSYGNELLSRNCYEGVFMQIFQAIDQDDESLVKNIKPQTQSEAIIFCNQFTDPLIQAACFNQVWPLFINHLKQNPNSLIDLCSYIDEKHKDVCIDPIISIMPMQLNFNVKQLVNYCLGYTTKDLQQKCFNIVTSRILVVDELLTDKAIQVCQNSTDEYSDVCLMKLIDILKHGRFTQKNDRSECQLFPLDYQYICYKDS